MLHYVASRHPLPGAAAHYTHVSGLRMPIVTELIKVSRRPRTCAAYDLHLSGCAVLCSHGVVVRYYRHGGSVGSIGISSINFLVVFDSPIRLPPNLEEGTSGLYTHLPRHVYVKRNTLKSTVVFFSTLHPPRHSTSVKQQYEWFNMPG